MKHETRFLTEFIKEIYVHCPECQQKARVTSEGLNAFKARATCTHCGYNKEWSVESRSNPKSFYTPHAIEQESIVLGAPVDCYFRLPLWYAAECCGEELFAYNTDHLVFLQSYVGDKLREREAGPEGWSNGSLQNRLPGWMLASRNREVVLKKISELLET
jgi:hypothetical protein